MIILENKQTGEQREVSDTGRLPPGWKIKAFVPDAKKTQKESRLRKAARDAKLAVWATKLGLPVADFLDAARWLLRKDCPFCQLGTQVLKRIDELGEAKAQEFVERILEAKQTGDEVALEQIRQELNG